MNNLEQGWINSNFGGHVDTVLNNWAEHANPALADSDSCGVICNGTDGNARTPMVKTAGHCSVTAATATPTPHSLTRPASQRTAEPAVTRSGTATAEPAATDSTAATAATAAPAA